ncbi:TraB/GumN family protein [Sphingopyxis solisilvae]|uniref:TraB/GumN family protein n=1 Tax=Sphingopyxis solisilvae TaxID=1886788 RepID=UPI001892CD5A|nr:TraB/GumN family protein [Sphingopyxis solisilvae]
MKKWFKILATTCAAIPFAQCAVLPGGNIAVAAEPVTAATATALTEANPALWVVKDEDTTVYLFGTVHVLKPGLSWFDAAVKDAFDKSDEMMLELVLPEDQAAVANTMMPLAMDKSGKTLPSRLTAEELKAYQAAMTSVGLPANTFDMFKPWLPAMTLSALPLSKHGYDPEQGVEKQLTKFAKDSGKPVAGLETLEQQLGFFDSLPETQQVAFLNSVVKDLDKLGPVLDKMVVLWAKGDPDGLAAAMNESMAATPELAQTLLYDRNARWAEQIQARMEQPGTVFVAVGAGHLAGEKSLQDYLAERGLTAARIDY